MASSAVSEQAGEPDDEVGKNPITQHETNETDELADLGERPPLDPHDLHGRKIARTTDVRTAR